MLDKLPYQVMMSAQSVYTANQMRDNKSDHRPSHQNCLDSKHYLEIISKLNNSNINNEAIPASTVKNGGCVKNGNPIHEELINVCMDEKSDNQSVRDRSAATPYNGQPQISSEKVDTESAETQVSGKVLTSKPIIHQHRHNLKTRFELLSTLGQGTYGKVKLAQEYKTAKKVAIKYIRKSKIEDESDLIRIRREIQIMSLLHHPHIVNVLEVFENKEKIVLVMEYAKGGELFEYINTQRRLNEKDARNIFRQIVSAVRHCHQKGIVHRDLKLENIVLTEGGNVKIADFGLSNYFDTDKLLTTYCGSPLYASPEVVMGVPYIGPEVDCWSLGVILYTLVYGAMPFDGSDFQMLKSQITKGIIYEPRILSSAHMLIRALLEPVPSLRATIDNIVHHWWTNTGWSHTVTGQPCNSVIHRRQQIINNNSSKRHSWNDVSSYSLFPKLDNTSIGTVTTGKESDGPKLFAADVPMNQDAIYANVAVQNKEDCDVLYANVNYNTNNNSTTSDSHIQFAKHSAESQPIDCSSGGSDVTNKNDVLNFSKDSIGYAVCEMLVEPEVLEGANPRNDARILKNKHAGLPSAMSEFSSIKSLYPKTNGSPSIHDGVTSEPDLLKHEHHLSQSEPRSNKPDIGRFKDRNLINLESKVIFDATRKPKRSILKKNTAPLSGCNSNSGGSLDRESEISVNELSLSAEMRENNTEPWFRYPDILNVLDQLESSDASLLSNVESHSPVEQSDNDGVYLNCLGGSPLNHSQTSNTHKNKHNSSVNGNSNIAPIKGILKRPKHVGCNDDYDNLPNVEDENVPFSKVEHFVQRCMYEENSRNSVSSLGSASSPDTLDQSFDSLDHVPSRSIASADEETDGYDSSKSEILDKDGRTIHIPQRTESSDFLYNDYNLDGKHSHEHKNLQTKVSSVFELNSQGDTPADVEIHHIYENSDFTDIQPNSSNQKTATNLKHVPSLSYKKSLFSQIRSKLRLRQRKALSLDQRQISSSENDLSKYGVKRDLFVMNFEQNLIDSPNP